MVGAIIGDIVGSRFEYHNIHTKMFFLFTPSCHITDDSILTRFIAKCYCPYSMFKYIKRLQKKIRM